MKFKRSGITLFLDPLSKDRVEYEKGKKVDVILSPSLYWVKRVSLPVKSVRDVKKLLPSIFEDTLVDGKYSYDAYKSGEDFFVFAYEDKKIISLLNDKGVNPSDISSVHFAQSEFSALESSMELNKDQAMYLKDEVLVLAPLSWVSEPTKMDLSTITLSKHTIKLQQYGHIVDNKSLYKIWSILLVLGVIIFVEGFIASQKKEGVLEAKDELFSKYKLQSTMMQNRSTLSRYSKIHERQTKIREYISYFLGMSLNAKQKIATIEYKNKSLKVTMIGFNNSSIKPILKLLNDKKVKFIHSLKDENLKVEIKI